MIDGLIQIWKWELDQRDDDLEYFHELYHENDIMSREEELVWEAQLENIQYRIDEALETLVNLRRIRDGRDPNVIWF